MLNTSTKLSRAATHSLGLLAAVLIIFTLSGCDLSRNYLKADRAANMEIQDFRDGLAERTADVDDDGSGGSKSAMSIPALQPYVSDVPETLKPMPLVSISVNQSVPLRDALFELAEQADYDLELDPRITGSVIFTARNKPFDEVVARLADVAGLRYKFENEVLRVELDTPYGKIYKIDYLSYIRSNKGNMRNNVAVVSGDGADTGSSYEASASSEADFWGELENNLTQILGGGTTGALKTRRDPRITAAAQNPEVAAVGVSSADGETQVNVAPPQAVLNVQSLPVDSEDEEAAANATGATFTLNKQAGIINVYGSESQHKEITNYLNILRRSVTAQVLIEAKILEVTLDDEHAAGVDWRALDLFSGEGTLNFLTSASGVTNLDLLGAGNGGTIDGQLAGDLVGNTGTDGTVVVGYAGNDVQALIRAISRFGTVRALASPRMTVLNNQSALLNVANNRVYFELDIDVTVQDGGGSQTEIDSEIKNVPEGVLVNVQPSIDLDRGTVSLAVRPTITSVVNSVPDPAVAFVAAECGLPCQNLASNIPELNVQEIDSVIQVNSGQPIVMGGLLQDKVTSGQGAVPVLGEIPMIGAAFRNHADHVRKTELIIFLKATILDNPGGTVHNTDKDLYRMYSGDRRPLKL